MASDTRGFRQFSGMRILLWHGYLLGGTGSNVYTRAPARGGGRARHQGVVFFAEAGARPDRPGGGGGRAGSGVVVFSQEPRPEQYALGGAETVRPDIGGLLPVFVLDRYEGDRKSTRLNSSPRSI